ncbi:MAG: ribose-phosphate diphosphokinase [Candidatus Micrarchaeota archaeon]|nr:ribose-phosphate diphosphokinase [Candidatus Micrarchaeota archaeon]
MDSNTNLPSPQLAGAVPEVAIRGSSHLFVSQNASYLFPSNVVLKNFNDKESHVFIQDINACAGKPAQVLHRCYPRQDSSLLQMMLMGKTISKVATHVEAIIPYLPYARQDKIWKPGEVLSAEIVVQMLAASGFNSIATFDCHFLKKQGIFNYGGIQIRNFSMSEELIAYFKARKPDAIFISPDQGASYIVDEVGGKSMVKTRGEYKNHKRTAARPVASLSANFEVAGKDVIILDDMVAGGGTMIKAIRAVLALGAKSVCCGCTHGLFLGDAYTKMQNAGAEEIVSSNTIASEASKIDILNTMRAKIIGQF